MKMKIKVDSRKVEKGDTFIALRGIDGDGHKFINKAIENGASKIICEEGSYSVETIVVKDTREYLINYLNENYGDKINKLKIIGITGTNDKTTSAYLFHEILNKIGKKCGYIGTIGFYINEKIRSLNNTTPDIYDLYELLLECYDKNCEYVIMEVSSQGLANKRVESLKFDYAVFTNLTQDHLDFHKTMENYALAKQELFKNLKSNGKAIINYDDNYKEYYLLKGNNNFTYGFNGGDFKITSYEVINHNTVFDVTYLNNTYSFKTNLIGKYNIYNLMSSIVIMALENIPFDLIIKSVCDLSLPKGRTETLKYNSNLIIVDYAHTPDAMIKVFEVAHEVTKGNVYVVFGCTGDRDKDKRIKMSRIACENAKHVIMTHDDPHFENQEEIYLDMTKGLKYDNYEIVRDRKDAKEVIDKLKNERHTIYIITARDSEFHDDPYIYSKNWLDKNKIYYDKLIVNAREKGEVCKRENIDLYIDDQLENCLNIVNTGIQTIMITDKKYDYDNITMLKNWDDIYNFISELEK